MDPKTISQPETATPETAAARLEAEVPTGKKSQSVTPRQQSPKQSPPQPGEQIGSESTVQIEPVGEEVEEEEDEFLETGWDGRSSLASTSIRSSIYQHTYENGRRYHSYKYGRYPIPNDDEEQNREAMNHAMMLELTDGELNIAPIGDSPQKILDLGTGTGIWAIDMADKYPSANVLGVDLSVMQPDWVPPNLRFIIDDIEEDVWANGSSWDYIHLRGMAVVLRDVEKVINHCFENLKPGGWIEFQEVHGQPHCDDGSVDLEDDIIGDYYTACVQAMRLFGMDLNIGLRLRSPLEKAGFVNVRKVVKKIPMGTWPRDRTLRVVGQYATILLEESLKALLEKPFQALGYTQEERVVWGAKVRQAARDVGRHQYWNFYFWVGQKPEQ